MKSFFFTEEAKTGNLLRLCRRWIGEWIRKSVPDLRLKFLLCVRNSELGASGAWRGRGHRERVNLRGVGDVRDAASVSVDAVSRNPREKKSGERRSWVREKNPEKNFENPKFKKILGSLFPFSFFYRDPDLCSVVLCRVEPIIVHLLPKLCCHQMAALSSIVSVQAAVYFTFPILYWSRIKS